MWASTNAARRGVRRFKRPRSFSINKLFGTVPPSVIYLHIEVTVLLREIMIRNGKILLNSRIGLLRRRSMLSLIASKSEWSIVAVRQTIDVFSNACWKHKGDTFLVIKRLSIDIDNLLHSVALSRPSLPEARIFESEANAKHHTFSVCVGFTLLLFDDDHNIRINLSFPPEAPKQSTWHHHQKKTGRRFSGHGRR